MLYKILELYNLTVWHIRTYTLSNFKLDPIQYFISYASS